MSLVKMPVKTVKFAKLTLRKDFNDEKKDYGLLAWSTRLGYPRISVFTSNIHNKSEHDEGFDYSKMITAPLDYVTLQMFFIAFNKVIEAETKHTETIECYNIEFVNNVRTENIVLQATVIIGKDIDGIIYLSAVAKDKREIKFDLLPDNRWYRHIGNDGVEYSKAAISHNFAKAYLRTVKVLMEGEVSKDMAVSKMKDPIPESTEVTTTTSISDMF